MPIFMDRHFVPQANARAVAEAHHEDLTIQDQYGCKCMTYWIDEDRGNVFCLIEAPDKDAVISMHQQAHGLVPHEIIQVSAEVVSAFLGRIHDPENTQYNEGALHVFSDPAFRAILIIEALDYILLQTSIGKEKASELFKYYHSVTHEQIKKYQGLNIELGGIRIAGSFASVSQAVSSALAIQQALNTEANVLQLRLGLHAGFPVRDHTELFGNTIRLSKYLCQTGKVNQLSVSSTIREYYKKEIRPESESLQRVLTPAEENNLYQLMSVLERSWQDNQFGVVEFCKLMGMSKSTLYRTCMQLTALSPNALIQEFRLAQSVELLRTQDRNIAQTTFDTGFSSPSYFSKCFQKRFGMLPMSYLKALTEV
jgi:AraC-like DNA-binding protein